MSTADAKLEKLLIVEREGVGGGGRGLNSTQLILPPLFIVTRVQLPLPFVLLWAPSSPVPLAVISKIDCA